MAHVSLSIFDRKKIKTHEDESTVLKVIEMLSHKQLLQQTILQRQCDLLVATGVPLQL